MDKTVSIRLNEEQTKQFEEIKNFLGLKNDAEVFRFLLSSFAKKFLDNQLRESEAQWNMRNVAFAAKKSVMEDIMDLMVDPTIIVNVVILLVDSRIWKNTSAKRSEAQWVS